MFYNPHSNRPVNRKPTPTVEQGLSLTLLLHLPKVTSSSRSSSWGCCPLPADTTPPMFVPTCKPASFLLMSPGGLQEQSIYHLKTKTKQALLETWQTDGLPMGGQKVSWPTVYENSLNSPAERPPLTILNINFAGQTTSSLPLWKLSLLFFSISFSTTFHPGCQVSGQVI